MSTVCIVFSPPEVRGGLNGASHEGSFVDRMLHSGKTMVVFYGSQTGTAEDFAQRIAKQAKRYGISATVCDPEECDMVSERSFLLQTLVKRTSLFYRKNFND